MIKQGFMVKIVSYAGDADDYNTSITQGLSARDALWLDQFYDRFYANVKHCNRDYQGSMSLIPVLEAIDYTIGKLGYIYDEKDYSIEEYNHNREDYANDFAYEFFGACCEYTGRIRTPDSIEIYNIPCDLPDLAGLIVQE